MNHPEPVLFPFEDFQLKHTQAIEALFKGREMPEGGPFCVCAPRAALAAIHGAPVTCNELPWDCPFGLNKRT